MENCKECHKDFEDYSVVEQGMMKGSKIENPVICQDCMGKGWSDNPEEVRDAIAKDPILSKHISCFI